MRGTWLLTVLPGALVSCGTPERLQAPVPEGAVSWSVTATADKKEIQVGEDLSVRVRVTHPHGAEFLIPTGAELEPFELIERIDEPATSPVKTRVTLRMAAYHLPREIEVPPIRVEYRVDSGEMTSVETEPIPIHLVTSLTPDVTDINDIKGPIEDLPVPTRWNVLWWVLAALLAALAAYYLYRKLRKDKAAPIDLAPGPPPIPPEVEAEQALRSLANEHLLEQARYLEFYTRLAEIMKRYAGRRFGVAYLERTTSEILSDLKASRLEIEELDRLRGILNAADLVKFARIRLPDEESQRMIPEGFRFVDATRPKPPIEAETRSSEEVARV